MLDFPVPSAALEKFVLAIVLLYAFLQGQGHRWRSRKGGRENPTPPGSREGWERARQLRPTRRPDARRQERPPRLSPMRLGALAGPFASDALAAAGHATHQCHVSDEGPRPATSVALVLPYVEIAALTATRYCKPMHPCQEFIYAIGLRASHQMVGDDQDRTRSRRAPARRQAQLRRRDAR
jgi:hypothetical protein